jgi:cellulose synthase/poly-beta-1,6-N-acetylglucosamine synthase-like glycosyltransferase/peptidoglycan/xylan/chitin deacetylase (PgdA/CDA1 family)
MTTTHRRTSRLPLPRPAMLLAALTAVVLVALLALEAYVDARFEPDAPVTGIAEARAAQTVPAAVQSGGPIIDTRTGQVHAYPLPDRTVALTFDDGPDPAWTPKIRQILAKYHVPGTFFVVGSQVSRHPGEVRELVAAGNELGVHTFTHPNMAQVPAWRRSLEYSQTQLAIAAATGQKTALLRLPYSSENNAIDDDTWSVMRQAGQLGYVLVDSDTDSADWSRPGVNKIIANATPRGGHGAAILMHDAGGDRSETVAALDRLIPELKADGYTFTTVSQALRTAHAGAGATTVTAAPGEKWRGDAVSGTIRFADRLLGVLGVLILVAGVLMLARTALMLLLARRRARAHEHARTGWPAVTQPVTVVVPAYNESANIAAAVTSIAGADHPGIEVVVVDDGSTDGTASIVDDLALRNVQVIRIPNGGKANALNVGIATARHDLIVTVDGDTVFEPASVRALVQPFADPRVGAVAGNVKVTNRRSLIGLWQHVEYVIGFNLERRLYEVVGCIPTVPGAIGAYRRQALRDAGGVTDRTLAEDTDLTMAITRAGWRVAYEPAAVAHTEAPSTLNQLWRQRFRWSYGTMQAMWAHRHAVVERGRSGRFGRVGLPLLALFGIVLPLLAPLIDVLTIYGVFFADWRRAVLAWGAMLLIQMVTALLALRLDRESLWAALAVPLQQFVFRQLTYLLLVKSFVTALTGARMRWQRIHRTGAAAAHHLRTVPPVVADPIVAEPIVAEPIVGEPVAAG